MNQTAGSQNAQSNTVVITNDGGPLHVRVSQSETGSAIGSGQSTITGSSFAATQGILQLNQSAGIGNAQANEAIVQIDATTVQAMSTTLKQFGTPKTLRYLAGRIMNGQNAYAYLLDFNKPDKLREVIVIDAGGKIAGLVFSIVK